MFARTLIFRKTGHVEGQEGLKTNRKTLSLELYYNNIGYLAGSLICRKAYGSRYVVALVCPSRMTKPASINGLMIWFTRALVRENAFSISGALTRPLSLRKRRMSSCRFVSNMRGAAIAILSESMRSFTLLKVSTTPSATYSSQLLR